MTTNRNKRPRKSNKLKVPRALIYLFQTGDEDQSRFPDYERYNEFIWFDSNFGPNLIDFWNTCRDELLADWAKKHSFTRPWAWWEYDAPEKRKPEESEIAYLQRLNLLTDKEKGMIENAKYSTETYAKAER